MNRLALPGIALAGALVGGIVVWGGTRASDTVRIEGIVHDYILDHPEILPQAIQKLQERESGKAVAAVGPDITKPYGSAVAGNPQGDVTLVEYFDYNCGYCRASLPLIDQLIARDPKLKVVFRDLPILAPSSADAARASLIAAQQGKFAGFHKALYAAGPVSDATIAATAAATGVDLARGDVKAADAEIARNMADMRALGITGTPSWVVGNRMLTGALPIAEIEKAIAAARGA
ncbi:disulfide bond formation protein DsbA [Sphingomonas sp. Leaf17]|uniref:DsbA family protein n=1 Tax=Sphingomonas sp. Leaf17 TaxID=1735683 RepID=UPI0006F494BE|nr:DsbA family protein [Sphingomonas sp. Leaf17]KQM64133.1 disulfide bond formation protein DsbA [Sphingomonas sp. Leaf17]